MARRLSGARLRDAAPLFAALGDPTRLALVALLCTLGPASIADLSEQVDVSRQAVTKHLRVLADAGLVRGSREGRRHVFRLERRRLAAARDTLARIDEKWDAALERLRVLVEDA